MPLIDGKYEIITERPLGPEQTLIEATAPDGAAVRIVWYELQPHQEARFEHYRRTIKRLKRSERAAVYDVVSRPGAHYVVWRPPGEARPAPADDDLRDALAEAGFDATAADVRRDGRRPVVFGLAFDDTPLPHVPATGASPSESVARRAWEPPLWLLTSLITLIFLGGAVGLLLAGLAVRSNDELVVVPPLAGADINAASELLHRLGLVAEAVPVASQAAVGTVLNSEPSQGSQLRPGRSVRLSYALPPGAVTPTEVPRIVARRYPEEVEASLQEAGLKLGVVSRIPAEQAAGLVISQSPAPGEIAGEGSEVDLLVSDGPAEELTFLPDLVGLPAEEARYLARLAGLRLDRIIEEQVPSEGAEAGTVVAQSLRPNQPIARDDAVLRLIVAGSSQPDRAPGGIPSLVGLTLEEARTLVRGTDVVVEEMSDRTLPEGVVDQLASEARDGARQVTLVVNVHPVPIPRPDVLARIREPEPRELAFRWLIEPGIPDQVARVYATPLDGEPTLVWVERVRGGQSVAGEWRTTHAGPVRFHLTLNDQPYGVELLVN